MLLLNVLSSSKDCKWQDQTNSNIKLILGMGHCTCTKCTCGQRNLKNLHLTLVPVCLYHQMPYSTSLIHPEK